MFNVRFGMQNGQLICLCNLAVMFYGLVRLSISKLKFTICGMKEYLGLPINVLDSIQVFL